MGGLDKQSVSWGWARCRTLGRIPPSPNLSEPKPGPDGQKNSISEMTLFLNFEFQILRCCARQRNALLLLRSSCDGLQWTLSPARPSTKRMFSNRTTLPQMFFGPHVMQKRHTLTGQHRHQVNAIVGRKVVTLKRSSWCVLNQPH